MTRTKPSCALCHSPLHSRWSEVIEGADRTNGQECPQSQCPRTEVLTAGAPSLCSVPAPGKGSICLLSAGHWVSSCPVSCPCQHLGGFRFFRALVEPSSPWSRHLSHSLFLRTCQLQHPLPDLLTHGASSPFPFQSSPGKEAYWAAPWVKQACLDQPTQSQVPSPEAAVS